MQKNDLLTIEFISLFTITFLALCNVAVFYNFHLHLQHIGFSGKEAGFIIGVYSLAAMIFYSIASRHVNPGNSFFCMVTGILCVAGCGVAYFFVDSFGGLVSVRVAHGAGIFLIMASCMVVMIEIIPPQKSGLAFSLYSVALLSPYSIMPAVSEIVAPLTDVPTQLYMATAALLLPAMGFAMRMRSRIKVLAPEPDMKTDKLTGKGGEWQNLLRKPVLSILLVNCVYFTLFSALYFLFKGFGVERGIKNPGFFFTTQMGIMVAIRLVGGQIFDRFSKVALVALALSLTGTGFGLLRVMPDTAWLLPIAVVFGLGMGLCVPPLNSLMYLVTSPRHRGYNANMMMLFVHIGMFIGPFFGSWIIDAGGYDMFLGVTILLTWGAAVFFVVINPAEDMGQNLDENAIGKKS